MIILASASPRRRELLSLITTDFIVSPTDADETVPDGLSPAEAVEHLSLVKSESINSKIDIVIGADTIVTINGKMLGKPEDDADAFNMLSFLSGKTHSVYTGVTVIKGDKKITFSEKTDVEFFPLTDEEINEYIATGEHSDKAGSYAIQGKGALFVKAIKGDYPNVIGLPVAKLKRVLDEI